MDIRQFDYTLPLLNDVVAVLDQQIDVIEAEANESFDPDQMGIYERWDWIAGMGFTACQTYITETHNWVAARGSSKHQAMELGPRHSTGLPVAKIVNAAANCWKHSAEWDWSKSDTRRESTVSVLETVLGEPMRGYAIGNVLYKLLDPEPPRFCHLVPLLLAWRRSIPMT